MSYFDSPKNRAMWERELKGLRAEKERRAREGYEPGARGPSEGGREKDNPMRRRITLQELERQELEESGIRRVPRPGRGRSAQMQPKEASMEEKSAGRQPLHPAGRRVR